MSFANEWLRYLEDNKKIIYGIILKGKRPEEMLYTLISTDAEEVKQTLQYRKGMKIPRRIEIIPTEVKEVEIEVSDGFTFYLSQDSSGRKIMKIRYITAQNRKLSFEEEKKIIKEAKKHGYEVVEFMQTDV